MRSSVALALAASLCATNLAGAQGDPCAAAIHDGVELRRRGRDDEALARFQSARPGCDAPRLRVQIAWAEQALGRWLAAREDLRAALATRNDAWVESRRTRLEGDLRAIEQHVGALQVMGGVDGAEVLVDGARVATLPMTEPLPAVVGVVRVEVRSEGRYPVVREVTIAAGAVAREQVELRQIPATPAPVPSTPPPPPEPARTPVVALPPQPPRPLPELPSSVLPRVGWSLLAAGGASLVAGVVLLGLREARASSFNNLAGMQCSERDGVALGGAECASLHAEAGAFGIAGVSALVAGASLSLGGVVLLLVAPRSARANPAVACAPGLLGASCALRF